jgi:outer membrane biosynthesis protein TonB
VPPKPQPAPEVVERPREVEPVTQEEPSPVPAPKPSHKQHVVVPSFTPANETTMRSKTRTQPTESDQSAEVSSAAQARRARRAIAEALNNLATGVQTSGAAATVVDMPGQGGGEAFVGYETLIYNIYHNAWITPDSVADKRAATDVKIIVAHDGSILSAEIINKSGERALDRSVDRVLHDVTHLPAFPEGARDEQRTFLLRFNLKEKEGAG